MSKLVKIDDLMQRDNLVLYATISDEARQRLIYYLGPGWYSLVLDGGLRQNYYIYGKTPTTSRILLALRLLPVSDVVEIDHV